VKENHSLNTVKLIAKRDLGFWSSVQLHSNQTSVIAAETYLGFGRVYIYTVVKTTAELIVKKQKEYNILK
jgi:hypothetical protein